MLRSAKALRRILRQVVWGTQFGTSRDLPRQTVFGNRALNRQATQLGAESKISLNFAPTLRATNTAHR
jgi:hypothetical protein